jgi:hypothetical protein
MESIVPFLGTDIYILSVSLSKVLKQYIVIPCCDILCKFLSLLHFQHKCLEAKYLYGRA